MSTRYKNANDVFILLHNVITIFRVGGIVFLKLEATYLLAFAVRFYSADI